MTGTGLRARLGRQAVRLRADPAGRLRVASAGHAGARRAEAGQAFLETVMATGFLVAIAVVLNRLFGPVILEAFEKISEALSSVGP
jgi:hypothetical protein